jgi:hypothetical protein
MAIIPLNQKFHTIDNSVVTKERGSALVNSQKEIYLTQDIIDTVSAFVGLGGTQYVFVAANGTNVQNAAELQAAYVTAQGMSPSITNRITVIAAPGNYDFSTANFEMDTQYIDLVSLDGNRSIVFNGLNTIEITANDVFVRGVDVGTLTFTIANSLNLLRVENCIGGDFSFGGNGGTASGTFTNCTGKNGSFGGSGGTASGTFTNCQGGDLSFGTYGTASGTFNSCIGLYESFGGQSTASGVFKYCTGGDFSFGGGNWASGTFTNCQGGDYSFGGQLDADGTFTNCTGGYGSFGGDSGTASGVFKYCTGGEFSFGGDSGTASGTFTNCIGTVGSFGSFGTASGTFNSCQGLVYSFGGSNSGIATASGVFTDCTGTDESFGSFGTASGTFNSCIGGDSSFGGGNGGTASGKFTSCIGENLSFGKSGILNGFLYYCRLTLGTFQTVSGGGRTVLCIDGNNNQNNQ